MKAKIYLIADRRGVQRMTKKAPDLFRGELAIAVNVVVPDSAFREPILTANLAVPEDAVIHPVIEMEVEQPVVAADPIEALSRTGDQP